MKHSFEERVEDVKTPKRYEYSSPLPRVPRLAHPPTAADDELHHNGNLSENSVRRNLIAIFKIVPDTAVPSPSSVSAWMKSS